MGRHRRSDAGRATTDRGPAATVHGADLGERPLSGAHRHRRRGSTAVRTGLLGVSAAVAMGAVAVATGVLPGGGSYSLGGDDGSDQVRSAGTPTGLETQGGTGGRVDGTGTAHPDRATRHAASPSARPSPSGDPAASKTAGRTPAAHTPAGRTTPAPATHGTGGSAPSSAPTTASAPAPTATTASKESAAEAQVLSLVNQERGKAGCQPLHSDKALAQLAGDFSTEMAAEGFFDHTDPQGRSPWDRAAAAGIHDLGGENIARGQADAAAVMDSWMHSAGHRANILNCQYESIGVGVHYGSGGPWWTEDFGF
ncbi:CAP domain-containing protein [Streptomyces sp. TS71-3]|uniref:CAP domain-containing protein n=1 Tax=Streptomyces sp. TS71-3 TaxID=2733862 RepID=UPI001B0A7637|nr:CAP domain-containing protein [Streptomyces sp. TS71-3]GHJ36282.1 membrane protein [Streptomyces sp. TS71-3]